MKLSCLLEKGENGEVYESDIDSSKIEIYITNEGEKSIFWFNPPSKRYDCKIGQIVGLENDVLRAKWSLTNEKGKYIDKEKCAISKRWFWIEKSMAKTIKEETFKTIETLEKLGYEIKIDEPSYHRFEVAVIWINVRKDGRERYTFGFHIDKETKELLKTFFTTHEYADQYVLEKLKEKYKNKGFDSNNCKNDLLEPIRFLQKMKFHILFK